MLRVRAYTPFARRLPAIKRRFTSFVPDLNPAARPSGLFLVGRIADDNRDRLRLFNCVCVAARLRDRLIQVSKCFLLR